ncbi:MAG TPA: hypothetical protein VLX68_05995 [Chitinivibrionales bacterium]|nr:hypothetical protein [Chitinivibrionales bacterium]
MPRPSILLFAIFPLLLFGCVANQIATLQSGTNINDVRKSLGREKDVINYSDYILFAYETEDPENYTVFKFVNGSLAAQEVVPKWVVKVINKSESSVKTSVRDYCAAARTLQKQKLNKAAYALMRTYFEQNPDSGMALICLTQLYLNDSLFDSAAAVYDNALMQEKRENARSSLQNNKLALFIRARRFQKAEDLGKALLADSTMPFKQGMHYNMACMYSLQNKKTEAIRELKEAFNAGDKGFTRKQLDHDKDLDNIRKEPGYVEIYKRLPTGK